MNREYDSRMKTSLTKNALHCSITLTLLLCSVAATTAQHSLAPSIATAGSGRLGIVHAMSAPATGIHLVVCDSIGAPDGRRVEVNASLRGRGNAVSIAASAGGFIVAWEQDIGAGSQVWCSRFSDAGDRIGEAVIVADSAGINARLPRIAAGSDGRCVVAWQDYRNNVPDLRYQLFDATLAKIGGNRLLAAYPGIPYSPVPAVSKENEIAFVYQHTINDTFHVCTRIAGWKNEPGPVMILDKARNRAYATDPDIVWNGPSEAVAVWKDYRVPHSDIYMQRFTRLGRLLGGNVKVNDDATVQWQRLPRVAAGASGLCVVWEDYRNDPRNQVGDVYCQWYTRKGKPLHRNKRVNSTHEPTHQSAPSVTFDITGRAAIAWCDAQSAVVAITGRHLAVGSAAGKALSITGDERVPLK